MANVLCHVVWAWASCFLGSAHWFILPTDRNTRFRNTWIALAVFMAHLDAADLSANWATSGIRYLALLPHVRHSPVNHYCLISK